MSLGRFALARQNPASLAIWGQQRRSLNYAGENGLREQYQQLLINIDDKLFSDRI